MSVMSQIRPSIPLQPRIRDVREADAGWITQITELTDVGHGWPGLQDDYSCSPTGSTNRCAE